MSNEKTNEFRVFIQAFIDANGEETLGKRIYWKNIPEKIAKNAVNGLKIPANESIMMIIDSTIFGSGKEGMALTDWGVRYNDGVKSWNLTWSNLSEKYSFAIKKNDALLLQAKPGDNLLVNKEANMSMASIEYDVLARILSKSCQIFTGKGVDIVNINTNNIPESKPEVQTAPEHEQSQPADKTLEKPAFSQEVEKQPKHEDDDEMVYRVFNYGKGSVPLPSLNPDEIQEFQLYIQKKIDEDVLLKSRSILNSGPSKEISALEAEFEYIEKEKLIFFFDISASEGRAYGVAFTNIGIHYRFYGDRKEQITWKQLAEEYAIRVKYSVEIVEPNSVMDEDAEPFMDIDLSQASNIDSTSANLLLFDIICKGCEIFTGIKRGSKNSNSEILKEQIVNKTGSILRRNPEGVIMTIIVSILVFLANRSVIGFILIPVLSFIGYILGNKLRLALHPDFVMASGFIGLLKQKIFWRFIPQLIGTFIGALIGSAIGMALF